MIEKKAMKELKVGDYFYFALNRWAQIKSIENLPDVGQCFVVAWGVNCFQDMVSGWYKETGEWLSMTKEFGDKQVFERY